MNNFFSPLAECRLLGYNLSDFGQTQKTSTRGIATPVTPAAQVWTNSNPVGSANYLNNGAMPNSQSSYGTPKPTPDTQNTGYTGGFKTLQDAQNAQNEYYKQHGSGDPSIDAAIYNLQNPGAAAQSQAEMAGAMQRQSTYLGTGGSTADEIAKTAANIRFVNPNDPGAQEINTRAAAAYSQAKAAEAQARDAEQNTKSRQASADAAATAAGNASNNKATGTTDTTQTKTGDQTQAGQGSVPPGFDAYLATLTQEQQALLAPLRYGLQGMDQALGGLATQAQGVKEGAYATADAAANRQKTMLDLASSELKANKDGLDTFLKEQQAEAQKNLIDQKNQAKLWNQFNKNEAIRKAESSKAETIANMAFAAAVSGGTFSSNTSYAISRAEASADANISQIIAEYGLKATDIDLDFTAKYTEVKKTFMNDMLTAAKDYSASRLDILGKQFASEDARDAAKQKADTDYLNILNNIGMKKAEGIQAAFKAVSDSLIAEKRAEATEAAADKRMKFQEAQADRRAAENKADNERSQMNQDKKIEMASADDIRSQVRNAQAQVPVKNYLELKSAAARANAVLTNALTTGNPIDLGVANIAVTTLLMKSMDPTTGVREQEFAKAGKSQNWINSVEATWKALNNGDRTGLSTDTIKAFNEAIQIMSEGQRAEAMASMTPALNALITHNNRSEFFPLNPADILPTEFLEDATEAFNSYTSAEARQGESYDFNWDSADEKPQAMRTDRNNNPIAVAMNGTSPNQFTRALDNAGIPWEPGDPFPGGSSMRTIRIKGDPIEASRAILSNSNAIENWYLNHTGSSVLPKYGVKTAEDFKNLPIEKQNAIIRGIYESEGGDGSLFS